jgi:hypothetical protein
MANMRRLAILRLLAGASLCTTWTMSSPAQSQSVQSEADLAVLYGANFIGSRLAIDVVSSGCTDESYFLVKVDAEGSNTYRLSIIARKQDRCRMAPYIVTLTLDLPDIPNLVETRFFLMNKFAAPLTLKKSAP